MTFRPFTGSGDSVNKLLVHDPKGYLIAVRDIRDGKIHPPWIVMQCHHCDMNVTVHLDGKYKPQMAWSECVLCDTRVYMVVIP